MSKFKMPSKFRNDRIHITPATYLKKREDAGEYNRVYDYYCDGQIVDTITVSQEDELRKEISVSMDGAIMSVMNAGTFSDPEKGYYMQMFLHVIHPELKEEFNKFVK